MSSATMTIRLNAEDKELISDYAKTFGKTVSDFMREAAIERIEDEIDLKAWEDANREFEQDSTVITAEEIEKKYL